MSPLSLSLRLKDEKNQADWSTASCLLLRLLAHDSAAVQTTAYTTFTVSLTTCTHTQQPHDSAPRTYIFLSHYKFMGKWGSGT